MLHKSLITWDGMNLKKIDKAYKKVRDIILFEAIDGETIDTIREGMEKLLPEYKIKCDEENNPPKSIDSGNVMVRVSDPKTLNFINVIF
jgi:predicted HicB family RNase H-like nuclease